MIWAGMRFMRSWNWPSRRMADFPYGVICPGDSQLLRDTHPDFDKVLPQLLPLADRMEVEEPLPDDGEPWVDPNDLVDFEGWE